jgi:SNF2 family DNA or RNA helicase
MRQLRPYQIAAIDFMKQTPRGGLFIDMGLGKTAIALHAMLDLPKPILLVGPIRVIENVWRQEAELWPATRGLRFSLVRGSKSERALARKQPADVYLTNPEILEESLKTLIIDESSQFKSHSTMRFKAIRKHVGSFSNRYILTGTPSPNSLLDLWSQIFILDQGERLETSFSRFRDRYFEPSDYMGYSYKPREGTLNQITSKISDLIFRVEAAGNLPPREVIRNIVSIDLPAPAKKVYKDIEKRAFAQLLQTTVTVASAAAGLMKLRQVASGFVYDDNQVATAIHTEKIKAVESILEETGSPVVLVYQFLHELAALKKAFPQGKNLETHLLPDWNSGKIPLLFLHPQSGGHGLNLQQGSHTMIIFSASFSYEYMAQTMARIDRQGQQHPVVFHFLVAKETVDELLLEVLDSKETVQSNVLNLVRRYAIGKTSHS